MRAKTSAHKTFQHVLGKQLVKGGPWLNIIENRACNGSPKRGTDEPSQIPRKTQPYEAPGSYCRMYSTETRKQTTEEGGHRGANKHEGKRFYICSQKYHGFQGPIILIFLAKVKATVVESPDAELQILWNCIPWGWLSIIHKFSNSWRVGAPYPDTVQGSIEHNL